MQEYIVKATPEDAGKRLDIFLFEFSQKNSLGLSRMSLQKLIKEDKITLKNAEGIKPHYKIKSGDEFLIRIEDKKESELLSEDIPLEIVYEDADLAVINKPEGLVTHPAPGNPGHTLVNALLYRFKELSDVNPQRPGILHRLDKETSGLLVIAKNNVAHHALVRQFADHSIRRKYIALVKGRIDFDENIIEAPIGRHPVKRKNMCVSFSENTRYAKTRYRTLKRGNDFSQVELEPFTGRTHQLRVHLAFLGHPILGDKKYGKHDDFPGLALHARYIGFVHPRTGKFMEFECELPSRFTEFLEKNKTC